MLILNNNRYYYMLIVDDMLYIACANRTYANSK